MKGGVKIEGIDTVMNNIHKELKHLEIKGLQGMIMAAVEIRRDMENTSPLIPIDVGNLRASWFVVTALGKAAPPALFQGENAGQMKSEHNQVMTTMQATTKSFKHPVLIMGFSANYAVYVHENIGATFQRPEAGAKFFESALHRNASKIVSIIKKYM